MIIPENVSLSCSTDNPLCLGVRGVLQTPPPGPVFVIVLSVAGKLHQVGGVAWSFADDRPLPLILPPSCHRKHDEVPVQQFWSGPFQQYHG